MVIGNKKKTTKANTMKKLLGIKTVSSLFVGLTLVAGCAIEGAPEPQPTDVTDSTESAVIASKPLCDEYKGKACVYGTDTPFACRVAGAPGESGRCTCLPTNKLRCIY